MILYTHAMGRCTCCKFRTHEHQFHQIYFGYENNYLNLGIVEIDFHSATARIPRGLSNVLES